MNKIIKSLTIFTATLCVLLGVSVIVNAESYSGTLDTNIAWELDSDSGVLTLTGTGEMSTLRSGYYPWKFPYNDELDDSLIKKVIISNGITSVSNYAFAYCTSITDVSLPDSVLTIGESAFSGCSTLTEITLPNSVLTIGESAFDGCSSLTEITLPNGLTTIEESTFSGTGITEVVIPSNVTSIGEYAFANCGNLTSITIPAKVENIQRRAFSNCKNLSILYYNAINCEYPWYQPYNDDIHSFNSSGTINGIDLIIGDSVSKLPSNFMHNTNVKSVSFGSGLTSLPVDAFSNCAKLSEIVIPENISKIDSSSFLGCSNLTSITLPNNIKSIGSHAFNGCGIKELIIPDSVSYLGSGAFRYCGNLQSITIGKGIKYIDDYTFERCSKLTDINLPDELMSIGYMAFYQCSSIKELNFPDSLTTIEGNAFNDCNGLTNVKIPVLVNSISSGAFGSCDNLQGFDVDNNNSFFYDVEGSLISKDKMTLIQYAKGKKDISYNVPEGVTSIDDDAFSGCNHLTTITIPNSVTSIGDFAFSGCNNLTNVTYIGSEEDYEKIIIGKYNEEFKNATLTYASNVKIYDFNDNLLSSKNQAINTILDLSEFVKFGYVCNIYTDKEKTNLFDITTPIIEDTVLYLDSDSIIKSNSLKLSNSQSAIRGETFAVTPYMATENDAYYMYYIMSYPDSLTLKGITPKAFSTVTEEDKSTSDGITTLALLCHNSTALPVNQVIVPFELSFEASKTATIGITDLTIDEATCYIGDDTYQFSELTSSNLTIEPKLAESISITGADTITGISTYTIAALPDYATYKVDWSVDKTEVAEVDANGVVTPKKSGTIILTATTTDGSNLTVTKEITISMKAKLNSVTSDIGEWDKSFNPDETKYTILVDKDATKVKFTLKCVVGATLTVNEESAIPNIPKTVTLYGNTTDVSIKISGVSDCEDNLYTFKVVKKVPATKTTVSADGKTFIVVPSYINSGNVVILALYNGDKFIEMHKAVYVGKDLEPFVTTEDYTTVKVFVWSGFDKLQPITDTEIVDLSK